MTPPYLAGLPTLSAAWRRRIEEDDALAQPLTPREETLLAKLVWRLAARIRIRRRQHELDHGPVPVEPPEGVGTLLGDTAGGPRD